MKNKLFLFAAVCAVCVFCSASAFAQSDSPKPSLLAADDVITIAHDNATSFYWDSYQGAYRVRHTDGAFMRFNITVKNVSSFEIVLNPWSYNSSWTSFDGNWMFSVPGFGQQGFQYTGQIWGTANSMITRINLPNTNGTSFTMEFNVPPYSPGYRTGSFTVRAGGYEKTIPIVQTTY